MKILFIFEKAICPTKGGLERVTHLLASELSRRGYEVQFLALGNDNYTGENIPQFNIDITNSDFATEFISFIKEGHFDTIIFQGHSNEVLTTMSLAEDIEAKKLSVFHYQPFPLIGKERVIKRNTPSSDLSLKGKILKYIALISPRIFRILYIKEGRRRFAQMLEKTDKMVLLSDKFKERFISYFPSDLNGKLTAINNPLTFSPSFNIDLQNKENIILFVARITNPQKNISGFIDVWKLFSKNHPDWKALIIGDGEHKELMEKYAQKKKTSNLFFLGTQENVEEYYRKAKMYCMTSTYEGWGMVLTEAMAMGCVPVVYGTYESTEDIIDSGTDGIIVKPFDTRGMAEDLSSLANNDTLREKMALNGMKKIDKFSINKITDEWEKLF